MRCLHNNIIIMLTSYVLSLSHAVQFPIAITVPRNSTTSTDSEAVAARYRYICQQLILKFTINHAALSREKTATILISVSVSLFFAAIVAVTVVVIIVGVCCFAIRKRRRFGSNGGYQFTPNETCNIREQVVHNDSGNSESPDLQSTTLYYDYVDNNHFTTVRAAAALQQPRHHNFL